MRPRRAGGGTARERGRMASSTSEHRPLCTPQKPQRSTALPALCAVRAVQRQGQRTPCTRFGAAVCARSAPEWCARDCSGSARGWGERPLGRVSAAPYRVQHRPIRARCYPDLCCIRSRDNTSQDKLSLRGAEPIQGGVPPVPPLSRVLRNLNFIVEIA